VLTLGARAFGRVSRTLHAYAARWEPVGAARESVIASTAYDMVTAPDESYYADQYRRLVAPHLAALPPDSHALDLGCGQGRFTIWLAKYCPEGRVTACDLSSRAIHAARGHATMAGVTHVDWRVESIADCLVRIPDESVGALLLTEVTFFHPSWRADLSRAVRALKIGGVAAISFRSQYFYALALAQLRRWDSTAHVTAHREGRLFEGATTFTWQTSAEMRQVLVEHGLGVLELCGIGTCSGIPGDPHAPICRPSALDSSERERLMDLELAMGRSVPDAGRYVLAVARRVA
jgi:SAM-dependent methyltransferase